MNVLIPKTEEEILKSAKDDSYGTWLSLRRIKNNEIIGKYIHLLETNLFRHREFYYDYEYWEVKEFKNKTFIENSHSGQIRKLQYRHLMKSYIPFWPHHIRDYLHDLNDERNLLLNALKTIKKYNQSWVEKQ